MLAKQRTTISSQSSQSSHAEHHASGGGKMAQVKERISTFEGKGSALSNHGDSRHVESRSSVMSVRNGVAHEQHHHHSGSGSLNGSTTHYAVMNGTGWHETGTKVLTDHTVVFTREEEKTLFQKLNDRLARYVELVRSLNDEKVMLRQQISELSTFSTSKQGRLDANYLSQINDANKLIEKVIKEKAAIELELKNLRGDYDHQRVRADKLEVELSQMASERNMALKQLEEFKSKFSMTEIRIRELEQVNRDVKITTGSFQKTIDDLRARLDTEVRKKGEWESQYIAMKSQLDTTIRNHSVEMEEYKSLVMKKVDIEYVSREFTEEILEKIRQMRLDFDRRLQEHRMGVKKLELGSLHFESAQLTKLVSEVTSARDTASRYQSRISELEIKLHGYEADAARMQTRIREMEALMASSGQMIDIDSLVHDTYRSVKEEIAMTNEKIEKYDYLLGLKVRLDTELQAYQALLELEEARLRIGYIKETPVTHKHTSRSTATKGHSEVEVVIDEVNMEGKYVHLTNKGEESMNLDHWTIRCEAGKEPKSFKLPSGHTLKPGKALRIWSSHVGKKTSEDAIVADVHWPHGDHIRVELIDPQGVMQAWHESFYEAVVDTQHHMHVEYGSVNTPIGGGALLQKTTFH